MKPLYPGIKINEQYSIAVETPHVLYVEESGERTGVPILFVHGGPGVGCSADDRRFFDPERYRIVLFDQRGCGQSTPHGHLENNTIWALVSDMERIREHLGIKRWILFGGSWGSTLSLVYAQMHPERVLGLILRGVFLARTQEIEWLYHSGSSRIFPDHWETFIAPIPENERDNLIAAYYKRLTGEDELQRMNAAKHWAQWEGQCATLHTSKSVCERLTNVRTALSLSQLETHYFMHDSFLEPNQILRDMPKIAHIPGIIVHGRYDMLCPLDNAYALHKAWPGSQLQIIRDAGHAASETGITDALINATDSYATL